MRAIFRELHIARVAGRGPFPNGKAGPIVWACLQAQIRMNEFLENGFAADPKLSHILNIHLQDNAVMKSTFVTLQAKVTELASSISNTKLVADAAKTQVDKAMRKTSGS